MRIALSILAKGKTTWPGSSKKLLARQKVFSCTDEPSLEKREGRIGD